MIKYSNNETILTLRCENGCVSGDYQYKRIHKGTILEDTTTTEQDVIANVEGGFQLLQTSFEHNVAQLEELKHYEIGPDDIYRILGILFISKGIVNTGQITTIKRELHSSKHFRHIEDKDFTAFDLYNHITESLKTSAPSDYINDHVQTHKLFEETFNV